jgi:phenylacetate-coenzyme A ligase PaaK-like adenylate-forming protein
VLERAPEGSDRLTLMLEAAPGFGPDAVARLRGELKARLNVSPEVTVMKEGELPRPPGKAVRVVDRRR